MLSNRIVNALRRARLRQGLTLEDLARMTGIAAPNLSRLEQGRVDARLSTITRVARALGLRMALLPATETSLDLVRQRMATGAERLRRAGLGQRDVDARLAWKDKRGIDTTVERRLVGTE